MGQEKGLVPYHGKPMLQWVIEAAKQVCDEIILVANDPRYATFGLPVVPDEVRGKGPLAGILTGLKNSKHDLNLILSCDVPDIHPDLLRFLISQGSSTRITIVEAEGRWHPLVGIYNKDIIPELEQSLAHDQLKLRNIIFSMEPRVLDLPLEMPGFEPIWLQNYNYLHEVQDSEQIPKHDKL